MAGSVDAISERTATLRSGLALPHAEAGDPRGVAVILVHAYAESWRYFEPLLQVLPGSIHAFAPTQRGHRSVEGDPTGYRLSDFATDVVDFMDAVGVPRAVLVGASSGGLVCQIVATTHPDRVDGLVLISSPVSLSDKPAVTAMGEQIMSLADPIDRQLVGQFVRDTSPEGISGDRVEALVEESFGIPAAVWREAFRGLLEADLPVALEAIDDVFVLDDQQILLDRLPDARLVLYDGVGHGVHLTHPDRVASDLSAFVLQR
jgi:pimeloyl-ACP methyl ester carboxylesterase